MENDMNLRTKFKEWRKKRKEKKANKKKAEFSKILAVWAMVVATAAAVASYILAFIGRMEIAGDIAVCIITACVGYLVTYAGKSLGEKISRNRHGLDADGNPIINEEETTQEESEDAESIVFKSDDSENGR